MSSALRNRSRASPSLSRLDSRSTTLRTSGVPPASGSSRCRNLRCGMAVSNNKVCAYGWSGGNHKSQNHHCLRLWRSHRCSTEGGPSRNSESSSHRSCDRLMASLLAYCQCGAYQPFRSSLSERSALFASWSMSARLACSARRRSSVSRTPSWSTFSFGSLSELSARSPPCVHFSQWCRLREEISATIYLLYSFATV